MQERKNMKEEARTVNQEWTSKKGEARRRISKKEEPRTEKQERRNKNEEARNKK